MDFRKKTVKTTTFIKIYKKVKQALESKTAIITLAFFVFASLTVLVVQPKIVFFNMGDFWFYVKGE